MAFSGFIEPNRDLENMDDPAAKLGIRIYSGYQAMAQAEDFVGQNRIFDRIFRRAKSATLPYEDQCSSRYYFDLVSTLRDFNGQFNRVAELGVFMGGATSVIAGCIAAFDFELDLIDISRPNLEFAYERTRRLYPEAASKIRIFHGDLPLYVRTVMMNDADTYLVHHDGAHNFEQVVKDLAALYYVREHVFAIIAQDTHLRGRISELNFVDLAIAAVFGADYKAAPIGTVYAADDPRTKPNEYQGNYFLPDVPEGLVLPMAANEFKYPHPRLSIDDFLPPED